MPRINRRAVMATAVAAATAAAFPARAAPVGANRVVFISDVHIGDNSPTVWYQKAFHEAFLSAFLDHVIEGADQIRELVILGDFIDFWTYPPNVRPPGVAAIVAANPNILGPRGKLAQAVTALGGRVSYVPGNHDMGITQAGVDLLAPGIRLRAETGHFPLREDRRLLCAHGHRHTLFNAPDLDTKLAPLPVGHFVTRSFSYYLQKTLKPGQTVADLPDQGEPNGFGLGKLAESIGPSLIDTGLKYAMKVTGIPADEPILLPSGAVTSFNEAQVIYRSLWSRWVKRAGGGADGEIEAGKATLADARGNYLPWFAQRAGLEAGADLVVMGHTHKPVRGLDGGFIDYVNTGFDCPSRADIGSKHPTFVEVDAQTLTPRLKQVAARGGTHVIEDFNGAAAERIVYGPTADYSSYVTIDNSRGTTDLMRTAQRAEHGRFIVDPPAVVRRGERARFWVQDYPGAHGSAGTAAYHSADGRALDLSFGCAIGLGSNLALGAPFRSRSGGADWQAPGVVARTGHPFFVEFQT
jgi:UDP-2,3-diacylglucosamine pyrophosphatase LpxH